MPMVSIGELEQQVKVAHVQQQLLEDCGDDGDVPLLGADTDLEIFTPELFKQALKNPMIAHGLGGRIAHRIPRRPDQHIIKRGD